MIFIVWLIFFQINNYEIHWGMVISGLITGDGFGISVKMDTFALA